MNDADRRLTGRPDDTVRRRRLWTLLITVMVVVALPALFGHRGTHAVRSLIVPGAGLYDHRHAWIGVAFTVSAVVAMVLWMRWGMDWLVGVVVIASMTTAAAMAYNAHPAVSGQVAYAAHEFPLVVLVMGALSGLRLAWRRSPLGRWQAARARAAGRVGLGEVDSCRVTSIAALAQSGVPPTELNIDRLLHRCRRVGIAARGRFTGDPMRTDHAHFRTALCLTGQLDPVALGNFRRDATRSSTGVPASEPGWVRLLDGTLAALALQRAGDAHVGERWSAAMQGPLSLRRGHRPGSTWTPLALRGPRSETWEQAAATGLARATGWIQDDADWTAVRTPVLAAAARGNAIAVDERLVAAGRIWLVFVDDEQAKRIVARVTGVA